MELFTALVKFAAIMLVAGAAFLVIGSFVAALPWYKRTTKPADGDPNLMYAGSGSPYGEQSHQREATIKRKAGDDSGGDGDGGGGDGGD